MVATKSQMTPLSTEITLAKKLFDRQRELNLSPHELRQAEHASFIALEAEQPDKHDEK